jgi:cytochrome P450
MRATVDFCSAEILQNPYPVYDRLRQEAPVTRVGPHGWWALTRHEDVVYALKHPELFSSAGVRSSTAAATEGERLSKETILGNRSVGSVDPPDHTRLRKLINVAFTPRAIARLEGRIRAITNELIDGILRKDEFDLMEELAIPLPVIVIAELLGVDPARRSDFKRWSDDALNPERGTREQSEEEIERIIQSRRALTAFFHQMIAGRREQPRDDLISDLVRAEVESESLSADEVFTMCISLLIAGNETTTNLIGNGTQVLLEHPEVLHKLRADPSLIPAFIEETLRYSGPAKEMMRRTTQDVTLAGVTIPKGEIVLALLAAANRDPAQFPDPNRFDITREPRPHVAFGFGIHFCVGAPLSRLEGRVAFEEILRRLPAFSRARDEVEWHASTILRGLKSLPLRYDRAHH